MTLSNRILPPLTDQNRAFWTGGSTGRLLIQRCARCRRWVHPPVEACVECGGELAPEPVSGRGTVFTFTENHQPFRPEVDVPFLIALVELVEQADLRLVTNLVGVDVADVTCGMAVEVVFEGHPDEVAVPLFRPLTDSPS